MTEPNWFQIKEDDEPIDAIYKTLKCLKIYSNIKKKDTLKILNDILIDQEREKLENEKEIWEMILNSVITKTDKKDDKITLKQLHRYIISNLNKIKGGKLLEQDEKKRKILKEHLKTSKWSKNFIEPTNKKVMYLQNVKFKK